jgi:predicted Zn-dependent peptidase
MKTTNEQLESGIRVLTGARPETGVCAIAADVQVGSLDEVSEQQWGAAHLLEHMGFKGTKTRTHLDIVREIEGRGGQVNAQTSHDRTVYYIITTMPHFEHAAELLHDVLFNSTFPEEEFEKEKKVVLEEIEQQEDNWISVLWHEFDRTMFGGTTRAHPIAGTRASIMALPRHQLLTFRLGNCTNDVVTIAAVGRGDGMEKHLCEVFGNLPKDGPAISSPSRASLLEDTKIEVPSKFSQCYQFTGMAGLTDREMYETPAASIVTTLLGEGMSSLLFQRIREQLGLAYQVGSFLDTNLRNGSFIAYAVTDPENADQAADETLKVFERVAAGEISDAELEEAKERVIGPMYTGSETSFDMLFRLICSVTATGDYLSLAQRELRFRSVSRNDVAEFMQRMLARPRLNVRLVPEGMVE